MVTIITHILDHAPSDTVLSNFSIHNRYTLLTELSTFRIYV